MISILSSAKLLDCKTPIGVPHFTQPQFCGAAALLIEALRSYSVAELQDMMAINASIARENFNRFQQWHLPFTAENARQAILTYNGEVFNGLKAKTLSNEDLLFAQERLYILSGLYGLLRPLDLIQPYRLEMAAKVFVDGNDSLYSFWSDKITSAISKVLKNHKDKTIINLASNEFSKVLNFNKLKAKVISPIFKEFRGDKPQMIVIYTKKARGLMSRFIIENRIEKPEEIKHFDREGYFYNQQYSTENEWVFTR